VVAVEFFYVSEKRRWSPQELAYEALTILVLAALLYSVLSTTSIVIPRKTAVEWGLCYTCVSVNGSGLAVEGTCISMYRVYIDGELASTCPSVACVRLSVPLDRPAAEVTVVTDDANATLRAVRLPNGAYALETPHGLAQAFCFRG